MRHEAPPMANPRLNCWWTILSLRRRMFAPLWRMAPRCPVKKAIPVDLKYCKT